MKEEEKTNRATAVEDKLEIRELQNFYVNSTISNLPELVEERKANLLFKFNEYLSKNTQIRYAKDGSSYKTVKANPIIINKYFFSSINPLSGYQPLYSPETLSIVFELYEDICSEVNERIGNYIPTLSNFCKFAGITNTTLKNYYNSSDLNMRVLVEKIEDYCFDTSVTASQLGIAKESITKYRMKTEIGRIEKEVPTIHIHQENIVDLKEVSSRLDSLINFNKKKVVEVKVDE